SRSAAPRRATASASSLQVRTGRSPTTTAGLSADHWAGPSSSPARLPPLISSHGRGLQLLQVGLRETRAAIPQDSGVLLRRAVQLVRARIVGMVLHPGVDPRADELYRAAQQHSA